MKQFNWSLSFVTILNAASPSRALKKTFGIHPETGRESEREGKSCDVTEVQSIRLEKKLEGP